MSDESRNEMQETADEMRTASVIAGATGAVDMAQGAETLDAAEAVADASRAALAAGASDVTRGGEHPGTFEPDGRHRR
jgi:hypothetical protein